MAEKTAESFPESEERIVFAIAAGLLVLVVFFVFTLISNSANEKYSALYFDPQKIVSSAPNGGNLTVRFFLENREQETTDYSIQIVVQGKIVSTEQVSLPDGEKREFEKTIQLDKSLASGEKILVQAFKGKNAEPTEISFWLKIEK